MTTLSLNLKKRLLLALRGGTKPAFDLEGFYRGLIERGLGVTLDAQGGGDDLFYYRLTIDSHLPWEQVEPWFEICHRSRLHVRLHENQVRVNHRRMEVGWHRPYEAMVRYDDRPQYRFQVWLVPH